MYDYIAYTEFCGLLLNIKRMGIMLYENFKGMHNI